MVDVDTAVRQSGVVPVVVVEETKHAVPLARALTAGGLPVAEVTFRTKMAVESLRAMSEVEGMLVGAGTVISVPQVEQAVDAGARFIVSPGLLPSVVTRCQELGVPLFPGAVTPSEIMQALDLGLTTCKFFPAATHGGPDALRALGGPFQKVQFIPTGGVKPGNLGDYLTLPNVAAVGGTWVASPDLLKAGEFDRIQDIASQAVSLVKEARNTR